MAPEPNPTKIKLSDVQIKPFDPKLDRTAFSCGRVNMDNYLKESVPVHHQKRRARVYCATYNDQLVGYYNLSAASRDPDTISAEAAKYFRIIKNAPCVYLGMLAVDANYQRNGIGKKLMVHAMETTLAVSDLIGVYALILDPVDQETADRYKKWGFDYFLKSEPAALRMFIPIGTIRSAVKREG